MTKMKVVKQMGNTVFKGLRELAENPVRMREITHSGALRSEGVARVSQKGSEREVCQE